MAKGKIKAADDLEAVEEEIAQESPIVKEGKIPEEPVEKTQEKPKIYRLRKGRASRVYFDGRVIQLLNCNQDTLKELYDKGCEYITEE